jgi:hypothetical protein
MRRPSRPPSPSTDGLDEFAWCEYWVETHESTGTLEFSVQDPFSTGVGRRRVSLDAAVIADARSRVISATTGT